MMDGQGGSAFAFGIAICTFNPDERLLARTLAAVSAQQIPAGLTVECVVIDNNSKPPVAERASVKAFLQSCPWARLISEPRSGLSYARVKAIEGTTSDFLCFVDDDNEPAPDYIANAHRILSEQSCIGVIGPGKITVDFVDGASVWFARTFAHHFQERDSAGLSYGCVPGTWTDYYPPGSCMVVRRDVLTRYRDSFLAGELTASDRVGTSLSSGGDTQIVWEAVKKNLAAGISSQLRATHMIPAKRATLAYIKRLSYGTSSSYLPALVSSFPSQRALIHPAPTDVRLFRDALKIFARRLLRLRMQLAPIDLAVLFGSAVGTLGATGERESKWIKRAVRLLSLE